MNLRRIIGIIVVLIGFGLFGISLYIKQQVAEGKIEVASAQKKVDQGKKIFSLSPATQPVGKELGNAFQGKIDAGQAEIAHYEEVARWFQISGIVVVVLGAVVIAIPTMKPKRRK